MWFLVSSVSLIGTMVRQIQKVFLLSVTTSNISSNSNLYSTLFHLNNQGPIWSWLTKKKMVQKSRDTVPLKEIQYFMASSLCNMLAYAKKQCSESGSLGIRFIFRIRIRDRSTDSDLDPCLICSLFYWNDLSFWCFIWLIIWF